MIKIFLKFFQWPDGDSNQSQVQPPRISLLLGVDSKKTQVLTPQQTFTFLFFNFCCIVLILSCISKSLVGQIMQLVGHQIIEPCSSFFFLMHARIFICQDGQIGRSFNCCNGIFCWRKRFLASFKLIQLYVIFSCFVSTVETCI